jgi:putative NADH-flavin reductase
MISFDKGTTGRYNGFPFRTEEYLMKLTIFGATGGTGKQLIEQALAAGNEVVAFARTPSKISTSHEHLAIVRGELADPAAIERAIRGADAVISVLGPRPQEDLRRMPLTQGMQNILAAMRKTNVRRLLISSTPSASDSNDLPEFKFKVLVGIIKYAMRPAYEEIVNVARMVRESDTDWTIVRVSMPNNAPGSGRIRAGYLGRKQVGTNISRADLAAFMLRQVKDPTYMRQAPAVSN